MTLPRFLIGIMILCWGWALDMLAYAIPMALLLESHHYVQRRWVFTQQEFYLLADVTSIALVVLIGYYLSTVQATHFLYAFIQVLPIVLFPLLLALLFSTTEKLGLDVFFYSLRRSKFSSPGTLEFEHVYLGVCLVSMSTMTEWRNWFPLFAGTVLMWVLWVNRPTAHRVHIWLLVILLSAGTGFVGQAGLRHAHMFVKEQFVEWLAGFINKDTDPYKTRTALGKVGQMKLSDSILFRVQSSRRETLPLLLQEASYDMTSDNDWLVLNPRFGRIDHPRKAEWRWQVGDENYLQFYQNFGSDRALLPVPTDAAVVYDLDAVEVSKSPYGSVRAVGINPESVYRVGLATNDQINGVPGSADLYLDPEQVALIDSVLGPFPDTTDPPARIERVKDFFKDYRYSLYQPATEMPATPLEDFLHNRKAGHCEYFASATVLMLRALSVPARYVVGYSLQEYSPTAGMYVVRSRHAHAWAIAFDGNQWQVVDTTPSLWLTRESQQSSRFQPMADLVSNLTFRGRLWWSRQTEQEKRIWLMVLGAALCVVLVWRMMGSPQISLQKTRHAGSAIQNWEGMESPLYDITALLIARGYWRQKGETLSHWFERIQQRELLEMLAFHYRWRFDPAGLTASEKQEFAKLVNHWLQSATADLRSN